MIIKIRCGDLVYMGKTPIGRATQDIVIRSSQSEHVVEIAKAITEGKILLKSDDSHLLDQYGFAMWQSSIQQRKNEIQRKYSNLTNADMESRLRSMEDWWNEQ